MTRANHRSAVCDRHVLLSLLDAAYQCVRPSGHAAGSATQHFGVAIETDDLLNALDRRPFDEEARRMGAEACARVLLNERYGWPIADLASPERVTFFVTDCFVFAERRDAEYAVFSTDLEENDKGEVETVHVWDDAKPRIIPMLPPIESFAGRP